jgi:hypothetical protein
MTTRGWGATGGNVKGEGDRQQLIRTEGVDKSQQIAAYGSANMLYKKLSHCISDFQKLIPP